MEMIRVTSSAIEAIGYDPHTQRMDIRFTGGRTYRFCRVPAETFERLMQASSKGDFYNSRIRGRFLC